MCEKSGVFNSNNVPYHHKKDVPYLYPYKKGVPYLAKIEAYRTVLPSLADRQFTIKLKVTQLKLRSESIYSFQKCKENKTETMCHRKRLINVEQNAYWLIIASVLLSECLVFTEHLEHPENTPMV